VPLDHLSRESDWFICDIPHSCVFISDIPHVCVRRLIHKCYDAIYKWYHSIDVTSLESYATWRIHMRANTWFAWHNTNMHVSCHSCHTWMSHVTGKWFRSRLNESCHIWVINLIYRDTSFHRRVTPHLLKSGPGHVTFFLGGEHLCRWITVKRMTAQKEWTSWGGFSKHSICGIDIVMSHYKWVMSHMNWSDHIWLSHVAHNWVMSCHV